MLARLVEQDINAREFGKRPSRNFRMAAAEYLDRNHHKRTIDNDGQLLANLLAYPNIGDTPLSKIHRGTFDDWVKHRQTETNNRGKPISVGTINHGLKVARQVLNQAANDWRDENGLTWLESAPKIKLLPDNDKRPPHPLTQKEQEKLFAALSGNLLLMAMFAVNTGCRESEICELRWKWERPVPALDTTVFVVPGEFVKNGLKRLVVLNSIARQVIEDRRGDHKTHVFTYRGNPVKRMHSSGWRNARTKVGLPDVRVHDLKHTFGARLRHNEVSHEDRQQLLGHKNRNMSTHYSEASLSLLIKAAEKVVPGAGTDESEAIVLRF